VSGCGPACLPLVSLCWGSGVSFAFTSFGVTVNPEKPVAEALEMMGREDVNQVPVVQQGKLAGIISRAHILRVLQARADWTFECVYVDVFSDYICLL